MFIYYIVFKEWTNRLRTYIFSSVNIYLLYMYNLVQNIKSIRTVSEKIRNRSIFF